MVKFDKKTIAGFIVAGLAFAFVLHLLFVHGWIDLFTDQKRLLDFIQQHHEYAVLIFISLQALQVVAAPIPGEVTGFAGGILFGTASGILYSTIGLTLGSWLAFMLGRLAGRPLVERIVRQETIKRYDYVMHHKGQFLAFLMFLVPGFPKDYLCWMLGMGHMSQREFLLVSTSGRLLGTVMLTLGGAFFRDKRYGALFILCGIGIAFALAMMIWRETIERSFRNMRAAQLMRSRTERQKKNEKR
jgi:uncharacterized membrane protein YdjX (TVP38/TMEM64 family)